MPSVDSFSPTMSWQPYPSPIAPSVDPFDATMSAPVTVTPFPGQPSLPFHLNAPDRQSVNDVSQQPIQVIPAPNVVRHPPLTTECF